MNEFDDRGKIDMTIAAITAGTRGKDDKKRAEAFATTVDDVRAQLIDKGDVGTEAVLDQGIDRAQIVGDQIADDVKLHGHWENGLEKARRMLGTPQNAVKQGILGCPSVVPKPAGRIGIRELR